MSCVQWNSIQSNAVFLLILFFSNPLLGEETITINLGPMGDNIPIPVFDQSLGVLTGAEVTFTLEAGDTDLGGNHTHGVPTVFHIGGQTGPGLDAHSPSVSLPQYSGGGLTTFTVPTFNVIENVSGAHSHSVDFGAATTNSAGTHDHPYNEQSFTQVFTGNDLAPFLGSSNFTLGPDGAVETASAGAHTHTFGLIGVNSGGTHKHTLSPDWSTSTKFIYDIPSFTADFDGDGDVDQNDLTDPFDGWEVRFGNDLDGINFLEWQRQLGSGVPAMTAYTRVPEPSSMLLVAFSLLTLTTGRKCV